VFIGYHDGVLGLNPYVNIAPTSIPIVRDGKLEFMSETKIITLCLKRLAILILVGETEKLIPKSFFQLNIESAPQKWPLRNPASYADMWHLRNSHEDRLPINALLKLMTDKSIKDEIEKYCRKINKFEVPDKFIPLLEKYMQDL
jgi:hypothetical protein